MKLIRKSEDNKIEKSVYLCGFEKVQFMFK